jgi:hypothetical protein
VDLLPIVSAIIVALGAVVGSVIAFLQWRTNRQKAVLELNDRRFRIYETVKNCVDQVNINSQRFDNELERKFLKAIEEAHFYFDDHLHDYLETLRKAILRVRDIEKEVARRQQQGKPTRPSPELAAEREQAMGRIHNFYEVAQAKFSNSRPRSWVRKLVAWQRRGPTHAP